MESTWYITSKLADIASEIAQVDQQIAVADQTVGAHAFHSIGNADAAQTLGALKARRADLATQRETLKAAEQEGRRLYGLAHTAEQKAAQVKRTAATRDDITAAFDEIRQFDAALVHLAERHRAVQAAVQKATSHGVLSADAVQHVISPAARALAFEHAGIGTLALHGGAKSPHSRSLESIAREYMRL